jgi:recombination protein RecA
MKKDSKIKAGLKKQQKETSVEVKKEKPMKEQIKDSAKSKVNHRDEVVGIAKTGVDLIDFVLCGGVPWGRMINIVGDSSSGKTFIAIEMIAFIKKTLKKKLKIFYDDAEEGFSFNTKRMYGFEMLPANKKQSRTIEEFDVNLQEEIASLEDDEFLIYVLDSFDALSTKAEQKFDAERFKALSKGKNFDEGSYGMSKQKYASEFFRLRCQDIGGKKVLLIIISQVRENIGVSFGEKLRRAGGKALDFYAYACLWLATCDKHFKQDRLTGVTVKVKAKKAKVERPNRECFIDLVFDYGIDNIKSNINFLYDLKTDIGKDKLKEDVKEKKENIFNKKKKGDVEKPKKDPKLLEWDGEDFTRMKLIKHIEENSLEAELSEKAKIKWDAIEEGISSKGRKNKWA